MPLIIQANIQAYFQALIQMPIQTLGDSKSPPSGHNPMGIFDKLTAGKDAMMAIAKGDHLTAGRIFLKGGDQAKALGQFFPGKHYLEAAGI